MLASVFFTFLVSGAVLQDDSNAIKEARHAIAIKDWRVAIQKSDLVSDPSDKARLYDEIVPELASVEMKAEFTGIIMRLFDDTKFSDSVRKTCMLKTVETLGRLQEKEFWELIKLCDSKIAANIIEGLISATNLNVMVENSDKNLIRLMDYYFHSDPDPIYVEPETELRTQLLGVLIYSLNSQETSPQSMKMQEFFRKCIVVNMNFLEACEMLREHEDVEWRSTRLSHKLDRLRWILARAHSKIGEENEASLIKSKLKGLLFKADAILQVASTAESFGIDTRQKLLDLISRFPDLSEGKPLSGDIAGMPNIDSVQVQYIKFLAKLISEEKATEREREFLFNVDPPLIQSAAEELIKNGTVKIGLGLEEFLKEPHKSALKQALIRVLVHCEEFDEAIRLAIEMNDLPKTKLQILRSNLSSQKFSELEISIAKEFLTSGKEMTYDESQAVFKVIRSLIGQGDYDHARQLILAVPQIDSRVAHYLELVEAEVASGDLDGGKDTLDKARELALNSPTIGNNAVICRELAMELVELEGIDQALSFIKDLELRFASEATIGSAYFEILLSLPNRGESERFIELAKSMPLTLAQSSSTFYVVRELLRTGDFEVAITLTGKVDSLENRCYLQFEIGKSLYAAGRESEANSIIESAMKQIPDLIRPKGNGRIATIGAQLAVAGDIESALRIAEMLPNLNNARLDMNYHKLAESLVVHCDASRLSETMSLARKLLSTGQSNRFNGEKALSDALFSRGEYNEARNVLMEIPIETERLRLLDRLDQLIQVRTKK